MLREYHESGMDSDRSKTAMARLNFIHGTYSKEISNADMLFTLSLFICEPAKWIDRSVSRRTERGICTVALYGHACPSVGPWNTLVARSR